jgi:predicted DNA-binding helix-hairpin-helix protein
MDVQRKLEILADAAKYDASCASSGTEKRDSSDGKGLGSTAPAIPTRRMDAASRS